jgi:HEAT repeat protein
MDTTTKPENKDVVALLRSFHSFEAEQREHAISALQSLDKESTVEILVKLLKDSDPDLRCDAAEALVRIDSKQGTETILPLLSDPDPAVRWNACGLLFDFGDERATPYLVRVLMEDPEAGVRFFASDALGNVGNLSALSALRHATQVDAGQDREGRRVSDAAREAIQSIQKRHSQGP